MITRRPRTHRFAAALAAGLLTFIVTCPGDEDAAASSSTAPAGLSEGRQEVSRKLEHALDELAGIRKEAGDVIVPLSKKINAMEKDLLNARKELQDAQNALDTRTLKLNNLHARIKALKQEKQYLRNLLGEYVRNLEAQLHIAQLKDYAPVIKEARLVLEDEDMPAQKSFGIQMAAVERSIERLEDLTGAHCFDGQAVTDSGVLTDGRYLILGPLAFFASRDGGAVGMAVERLGSKEPNVLPISLEHAGAAALQRSGAGAAERDAQAMIADTVRNGKGWLPLDATLGKAQKIAATKDTVTQHLKKGGIVVVPILGLAALAVLTALIKWIQLLRVPIPSGRSVQALLGDIRELRETEAAERVGTMRGPVARMLSTAVEHIREPAELIEELMYEHILDTRMRLLKGLPFLAVCASSAPLLGLLGTVTGIISTFRLITAFGSGDVKMLSAGISEALVTTELGLIVAIPTLLLHAILNRRARAIVDQMEKTAVAVLNQINGRSENTTPGPSSVAPDTPPPNTSAPATQVAAAPIMEAGT
jgi:biopolymer transport protein ExbB